MERRNRFKETGNYVMERGSNFIEGILNRTNNRHTVFNHSNSSTVNDNSSTVNDHSSTVNDSSINTTIGSHNKIEGNNIGTNINTSHNRTKGRNQQASQPHYHQSSRQRPFSRSRDHMRNQTSSHPSQVSSSRDHVPERSLPTHPISGTNQNASESHNWDHMAHRLAADQDVTPFQAPLNQRSLPGTNQNASESPSWDHMAHRPAARSRDHMRNQTLSHPSQVSRSRVHVPQHSLPTHPISDQDVTPSQAPRRNQRSLPGTNQNASESHTWDHMAHRLAADQGVTPFQALRLNQRSLPGTNQNASESPSWDHMAHRPAARSRDHMRNQTLSHPSQVSRSRVHVPQHSLPTHPISVPSAEDTDDEDLDFDDTETEDSGDEGYGWTMTMSYNFSNP